MKVLLLLPPQWDPIMPYLSLPALTAYLRSKGCEVVQRDLNIEVYNLFLSEGFLRDSLKRAEDQLEFLESRANLSQDEYKEYRFLSKVVMSGDFVIEELEGSKRVLTTQAFYEDPNAALRSKQLIENALRLVMACHYPARLSLEDFDMYYFQSAEGVVKAVYDEERNLFRSLLREHLLNSILAEDSDIVGISIAGGSQLIPGLTLASLIKEKKPETHICIGGPVFSRWADVLPGAKSFFQLFDSVVLQEGELPLLELVTALDEKKSLGDVPSLIYRDGEEIKVNPMKKEDFNSLPPPDFDGLPLDSYLAPELVLPVATSFGCYWRRCGFCDHGYYQNYYVTKDLDLVVEDFCHLMRKYGTNLFWFTDEANPYRRLNILAEKILEAGLDMKWYLFGRIEKGYTPELCQLLHRAGCRMFFWAVESGCQRVLDAMDKGTNLELIETVLRNSKQADIWNHAFIVIGFPSEERDEAQQTLDFVKRHSGLIDSIHDSLFALGKYTRVEREPERFHVAVMRDESQELQNWYPYIPEVGMSYFEALDFRAHFQNELRKVYPNYDFTILPWPYLFLYLHKKSPMEIRNIRAGVERFQPGVSDWEKVILKLKDGGFQRTFSFGLSKDKKGVERREYHIVYDLFSDRSLAISSRAKEIIALSCRGENLGQIMAKLSAETDLSRERVKTACIEFAKDLAGRGFLTFDYES